MKSDLWQRTAATWFGLSRRVQRADYLTAGIVLAIIKYTFEITIFWLFAGRLLTPLDFVNPLLGAREAMLSPAPPWLLWLLYLWTLPFLWVAVSMTIRRVADAGGSPWIGFLVLVPLVNLFVMFALCLWPSV